MTDATPRRQRVGLALGSGSARGWAHVGVIRELAALDIVPDIVCGCSIGALVGASYANGDLDKFETWIRGLAWKDMVGLLDLTLSGGLLKGDKLMTFFEHQFGERDFASLPMPFACVATELTTGREIWLREGSVAAAVRASIALPGLFAPVPHEGRLLVDGGLVNPVPVSLCRAMGADLVVAVDLGADIVGSSLRKAEAERKESLPNWGRRLLDRLGWTRNGDMPPLSSVMATSIHIMQTRIARSRLAGEPADVLLAPRLAQLALMDYHRADEAIAEGRAAVERMRPVLEHALNR